MKHKVQAVYAGLIKDFRNKPDGMMHRLTDSVVVNKRGYKIIATAETFTHGEPVRYFVIEFRTSHEPFVSVKFNLNQHGGVYQSLEEEQVDLEPFVDALVKVFDLEQQFRCPISVKEVPPFPANCNPFHYDVFNMGCDISGGWMAMYSGHFGKDEKGVPRPEPETIILVNVRTGRRFELDMHGANKPIPEPLRQQYKNDALAMFKRMGLEEATPAEAQVGTTNETPVTPEDVRKDG